MDKKIYHLGLTMAGAVSGGAYTGGVMDYLFETLDRWQNIKDVLRKDSEGKQLSPDELILADKFKCKIPLHDVQIDVMGGASAGGMTTSMALLAAFNKHKPIKTLDDAKKDELTGNLFYDNWVLLRDLEGSETIKQLLNTNDLNNGHFNSILNSDVIDQLSEAAFRNSDAINSSTLLPYFNKNLELILTICSLRGTPVNIKFLSDTNSLEIPPAHKMENHAIRAHFKLRGNENDGFLSLPDQIDLWKKCSVATGAFPFGLRPRTFKEFKLDYIVKDLQRTLSDKGEIELEIDNNNASEFEFTAIDGGTLNNEPFGEVKQALKRLAGDEQQGVVMIDPFPNFEEEPKWDLNPSLFDLPGQVLTTLRHQAMFKQNELAEYYLKERKNNFKRYMIFPSKFTDGKGWSEKDANPMACGSVGAFGGFFDINFRIHDYFLGRDNCKQFLRHFFVLEQSNELFNTSFEKDTNPFLKESDGKKYLPIIPDPEILLELEDINKRPEAPSYVFPEKPQYNSSKLTDLKPDIDKRVLKLLEKSVQQVFKKSNEEESDTMKAKLIESGIKVVFFLTKGILAGYVSKRLIDSIKDDFKTRKLI